MNSNCYTESTESWSIKPPRHATTGSFVLLLVVSPPTTLECNYRCLLHMQIYPVFTWAIRIRCFSRNITTSVLINWPTHRGSAVVLGTWIVLEGQGVRTVFTWAIRIRRCFGRNIATHVLINWPTHRKSAIVLGTWTVLEVQGVSVINWPTHRGSAVVLATWTVPEVRGVRISVLSVLMLTG